MEGGAQALVSLGTQVVVCKGRKAGAEGMALVGQPLEEVVARPLETQTGERPEWRKSNPGREGARVSSQRWQNREKSECGFPRDTGLQHADGHDDLGKSPSC